jgi:hypothetical protein
MEAARPASWWGRNWKWVVFGGGAATLLAVGGCVAGIFFRILGTIRSAEPYQRALRAVRASPAAVAALGEPIEERGMPQGSIDLSNASLRIGVSGLQGRGVVAVEAFRAGGVWSYTTLELRVEGSGGEPIDLLR